MFKLQQDEIIPFIVNENKDLSTATLIKVIGVGGGGSNAVDYMYRRHIEQVSFAVCNTDGQALRNLKVPYQLLLGEGIGAGGDAQKARNIAESHLKEIDRMLDDKTRMVFITAGMGGGTGTGVAPVIAREANKKGMLTIAVVTLPFKLELKQKIDQALDGLEELGKYTDALIIINNEYLRIAYPELSYMQADEKVHEVLCNAVLSVTDVVTKSTHINADFNDVIAVLKDSGVAVVNRVFKQGVNRIQKALESVIQSPLLNNSSIFEAKSLLIVIYSNPNNNPLMMYEIDELEDFMLRFNHYNIKTKIAYGYDEGLGEQIQVILLASGFDTYHLESLEARKKERQALQKEKERQLKVRYEQKKQSFYGMLQTKNVHDFRTKIYVFQRTDLLNDELINLTASLPTYKRSVKDVDALHLLSQKESQKPAKLNNNIEEEKRTLVVSLDHEDLVH